MNVDLMTIVRSQLKRPRTPPTRIDLSLNPEDSQPGHASGVIFKMEEFEQELLLSSLFTPVQEDRAACEAGLAASGLTRDAMADLIASLVQETLSFPVTTGDRKGFCPIPEVVLARYVRLLGLDLPVPAECVTWIESLLSGQERHMAVSLARRPVWQTPHGNRLLLRVVQAWVAGGAMSVAKMEFVTEFVRTYRCRGEADLVTGLQSLIESYRIDAEHPTFNNPALEDKQGESIRSRYCDESVRRHRVTMARALLEDLDRVPLAG
ncbi:MAG: hypothetical protein G8237_02745 [Magnetococcales bacterium]|nr:hypothetical protein [Magnetococcales bacterium]